MTLCPLPVSRKAKEPDSLLPGFVLELKEEEDKHRRITKLERLIWEKVHILMITTQRKNKDKNICEFITVLLSPISLLAAGGEEAKDGEQASNH